MSTERSTASDTERTKNRSQRRVLRRGIDGDGQHSARQARANKGGQWQNGEMN